jgi:hypothetical protein
MSEIPDYLKEADRYWLPYRFRLLSRLSLTRLPVEATLLSTGETVTLVSWRRAWFGISLTLQFTDGRIQHGYDPSTIKIVP